MADDNELNININANAAGVEGGSRRAKGAIKGVTDESKQLEAAFRRIKSAIDPTFAAQERYNKTLADARALLDAGIIKKKEYKQALDAAKAALDAETASIMRNSAAGRQAAAEEKASKAAAAAAAKEAAAAAAQAAREKVAAERQAAREAAAAAKQKAAEEKAAIRDAANAAKMAAKEKAAAEKAAAQEAAAAAKEAAQQEAADKRAQAAAERAAMKEASEAEKQARREQKAAAKDAAAAAAQAAREKATAEKEAAAAARAAAKAEADAAKSAAQEAQAAQELRASIDPAYAAQMRYNNTMATAKRLLDAEKISQQEFIAVQKQAKAQMDVNVRSMGRFNSVNVQMGYQMQDVVASFASGINPLVILAQQGGQTAAAMSQMGGKIGAVASFMAGPWGAAIIGFTMVCGYLWQSLDDGKKKTLDLNDAESRRTSTVKDLTEALRNYNQQQEQSNNENLTNLQQTDVLNLNTQADAMGKVAAQQAKVNELQKTYDDLRAGKGLFAGLPVVGQAAALGIAYGRLTLAQKELSRDQELLKVSTDALTNSRIAYNRAIAQATPEDIKHQRILQQITDTFKASAKTQADSNAQVAAERKENDRYTAAKEREAQARRENAAAARDEAKEIFHTRQQAIGEAGHELQKAGYSVGENAQFGGIHGNHPGMGNAAHAQFAIDVNMPGVGNESENAAAKKAMDKMVAAYQARGFRILWNGKVYQPNANGPSYDIPANQNQHRDHVHIEAPASIVGKPAGKELANQLVAADKEVESEEHRHAREQLENEVGLLEDKKALYRDDLYAQLNVQDEIEAKTAQFYGAQSKQAAAEHKKTIDLEYEIGQQEIRIAQDTIAKRLTIAEQGADAEKAIRDAARGTQGDVVDFKSQNGLIGQREALNEKKQILAEEYTDETNFEERVYALKVQSVRDQLALEDLTKDARRKLLDELETMEAEHQNKMTGLKANYARNSQQLDMQTAQVTLSTWRDMFQTVGQSLNSTFQGLWTRSMTVWQGLINLGDQIVYKFADMGEKVLVDWLTKQAVKMGLVHIQQAQETAAVAAGEAARTGITASGTAARTGIGAASVGVHMAQQAAKTGASVTSEAVQTGAKVTGEATRGTVGAAGAVAEIGTRAATSAAGAFSSTVVIPFIGPVAAPIAAAAALAAVLGFAALVSARGGQAEVPFDGQLSMLHKKEMVLPAWAAEPLRANLRSGAGSAGVFGGAASAASDIRNSTVNGGDTHLHYGPQYGAPPREMDMDSLLRRDGNRLIRWLKKQQRDGVFVGGSK